MGKFWVFRSFLKQASLQAEGEGAITERSDVMGVRDSQQGLTVPPATLPPQRGRAGTG